MYTSCSASRNSPALQPQITDKKSGSISLKLFGSSGRKRSIIVKEPPVAFLPGLASLTPQMSAEVLTNERMGIQIARIVWIFSREESCSSQLGKNHAPLGRAQISY